MLNDLHKQQVKNKAADNPESVGIGVSCWVYDGTRLELRHFHEAGPNFFALQVGLAPYDISIFFENAEAVQSFAEEILRQLAEVDEPCKKVVLEGGWPS